MSTHRLAAAFEMPAAGAGTLQEAFPGFATEVSGADRRRWLTALLAAGLHRWLTALLAAGLHLGMLGLLVLLASLAPDLAEQLIPVQILRDEPTPEPAPARKALAERRSLNYAPALQAVAPQIVNPRVVAEAAPRIAAETLQMDAVTAAAAPVQIQRSSTVVERVSAINSIATARASAVDVSNVGAPVVRGPLRADLPAGPSVGPRQVVAAAGGTTSGTGKLQIGGGSSVREGVLSTRDVLGSPDGAPLANVNTAVGDGNLRGSGGEGTGLGPSTAGSMQCFERPEVLSYLGQVQEKTLQRWILPPGVAADQQVTLRFRLDVAGSANKVSLVRASDNALGASAVDALRSASPFPPMPDGARCLVSTPIVATFTNPVAG